MNGIPTEHDTLLRLWQEYKAQCATADGLPDLDQYAAQQIHALQAENARLREALAPFAREAAIIDPDLRTVLRYGFSHDLHVLAITTDHLMAAKKALEGGAS